MPPKGPDALFSAPHLAFFQHVFARTARRHMRALRLAAWGAPAVPPDRPLVVFASHPSWWDGVAFILLARALFPERRMYIPMQAQALARHGFMRRIGVFGVDATSPRGTLDFLETAQRLLAAPGAMLWLNAPGRFVDVRERPVPIAAGLLRLPERIPGALYLPLALDYPFWTERRAEMLAGFGDPLDGADLAALARPDRAAHLAAALGGCQDRLARDAMARDPARFRVIEQGREGMGGIYDLWRRARALAAGRRFDPRHDPGA